MQRKGIQAHVLGALLLLATGAAGQAAEGGSGQADPAVDTMLSGPADTREAGATVAQAPGTSTADLKDPLDASEATGSGSPGHALSYGDPDVWGEWYERPNLVRPLRVGATMVGGAVGGIVATGAVFFASASILCAGAWGIGGDGWCFIGPLVLGVLTGGVAVPVAMWMTGNLLNGDGNFWATLGGAAAGALVGSLTANALISGDNIKSTTYLVASLLYGVTPFLGGALLYEFTSSTSASSERRRRTQTLGVVPNLIATRNGGLAPGLALGGRWD